MNYSGSEDKLKRQNLLISTIYFYQSEYDLAFQYINDYVEIYYSDLRAYQMLGDYFSILMTLFLHFLIIDKHKF